MALHGVGCFSAAGVIFLAALLPMRCDAHAYLTWPPARNAIKPLNYCAHCMQAGGPDTVKERGGNVWPTPPGSHGLCGDPCQGSSVAPSMADEPAMIPMDPQATFTSGSIVDLKIAISTHHMGHFEFRICDTPLDGRILSSEAEGQACLDRWQLKRAPLPPSCAGVTDNSRPDCQPIDENNPGRWYLPPRHSVPLASPALDVPYLDSLATASGIDEIYTMRYVIPDNLTCSHCTLQWYWSSGNSCLYDKHYFTYFQKLQSMGWDAAPWAPHALASWANCENSCCKSGRFTEEFWNCADIAILPSDGSAPPPSSSPPVHTPPADAPSSPRPGGEPAPEPEPKPEPEPEPTPEPVPRVGFGSPVSSGSQLFLRTTLANYIGFSAGGDVAVSDADPSGSKMVTVTKVAGDGDLVSGDRVYLKMSDGKRLTMQQDGGLTAMTQPNDEQVFVISKVQGSGAINLGDSITLRSRCGKFITADKTAVGMEAGLTLNSRLVLESSDSSKASAKAAGTDVLSGDRIHLKASNGEYATVKDGMVLVKSAERGFLESFVIETAAGGLVHSGDTIYLRTLHGTRLTADDDAVHAKWNHRGAWQAFVIENSARDGEIHIGDMVTLRAFTGRYLTRGNNHLRSNGGSQGLDQQFTVESATGVSLLQSGTPVVSGRL